MGGSEEQTSRDSRAAPLRQKSRGDVAPCSLCSYGYEPKERSVVQSAELMCVGRTGQPDKSDLRPNAVIREILALANQPLP